MTADLKLPPLGLYVHLPWCVRKCPYCDFNSHTLHGDLPTQAYVDALIRDLDNDLKLVWGRTVHSIFFGGGTPSLFDGAAFDQLISEIRARLIVAPGAEITLEANPGTIERDSFTAYRDAGINRVSLGAQTFNDGLLPKIGRIHGRAEIENAIASLHDAALNNFNIDLMFGLPGQSPEMAVEDVRAAIAANPTHLSHYQLTLEPNTAFAATPPGGLPDNDEAWAIQEACGSVAREAGFSQYELSAWARPGRECRHNQGYWSFGDYLGIGAGAHAKLSLPATGEVVRLAKSRHPKRYLAGDFLAEQRSIAAPDLVFEFFLNAVRLRGGVARSSFSDRTGLDWAAAESGVEKALNKGLLEVTEERIRPSELGWRFNNDLQACFLP